VAPAAGDRVTVSAVSGQVDPAVAREASDAIGDDIEKIQRHVTRMRAHAEKLGDRGALATLDNVEKQLGVARRSHASLHKHHAEDQIDPKTAMQLAQQVNDALRAAHSEHDKIMKQLHETEASVGN
jgi:cytochrome c556